MCIAVPVSADGPPKGILLCSSAGVLYVEPPAAVSLNNDLAAARGEVCSELQRKEILMRSRAALKWL